MPSIDPPHGAGLARWPSNDWHTKLFKNLRSQVEAAIDPKEPAGVQPLGRLAQAGQPPLPSPALAQVFGVFEAWLDLSRVVVPGHPTTPPHREEWASSFALPQYLVSVNLH